VVVHVLAAVARVLEGVREDVEIGRVGVNEADVAALLGVVGLGKVTVGDALSVDGCT
jgi:hypothetical protein